MWHIPEDCWQMLWLFADEIGGIHLEAICELA
jgi:hypothetical protein